MVDDLGSFPRPVLGALAAAERLLSRRTGATIVLADPEDLGGSDRSVVARARVARNPFSLPRTLVVKHYRDDPSPGRPDPFPFEVASAQLFTSMSPELRPSPVLIAHDPASRLLVMEDLGRSSTLADKLFGPDGAAAQRCLLSWAGALGRMQAATAGREKDFGALLRRLGERAWRDPMADEARAAFAGVAGLLRDELGVVATPAAIQEAHDTARLLGGTRYRAFSPSDTCPDNNLVTSRGVRFVDFEWGCFRDIVLDAAYFRVPFPGCEASFALPPGMADTLLDTWRNEIAAVWPDLDESGRLARPPLRRAAAVGVAVHVVVPAAHQGARPARRAGCRALAPDQHCPVALLGPAGRRRRRRGEVGDGRAGRRGGRGVEQALPGRARSAAGLPGVPHRGLRQRLGSGTAPRGRVRRRDGQARLDQPELRAGAGRADPGDAAVGLVLAAPREPGGVVRGAGERAQRAGSGGLHGSEGAGGGLRNGYGTANNAVR